ncbi:hypothetical protein FB451DRAFT_1164797 [Mycena latifolia]|nr:hypothetical protein FB451DRAFT_1164797 [Mycena latifolia]
MSTSNEQEDNPQGSSPLRIKQRRAGLACTNCRRRKIRCLSNERFPTQPCERCRRRHLTCEYLRIAEKEEHSNPASPPPDSFLSDPPEVGGIPMASTPPGPAAPNFSRGLGSAPPLPYTGPPPLNRPLRGVPYYDPVLPAAHHPSMQPAYLNPYFTGRDTGAVDPRYSAPSSYSSYPSPSLPAPNQTYMQPTPAYPSGSRSNRPFPPPLPNQQVTQGPDLRGVDGQYSSDYISYMQMFEDTRSSKNWDSREQ